MSVILNGVSIQTASERKLFFKEHRTNGHDGSGLFKCTQCEKSFLSHKQLTHHNWDHKARKTFLNCEICDKSVSKANYKRHKAMVHSVKNLQCQYCPSKFGQTHILNQHIKKTHTKPFQCNLCSKRFGTQG